MPLACFFRLTGWWARTLLQKLKNADTTIALLSDTSEMFAEARRNWVFSEYFDHIFLSFEIGFKKPDVRAFQTVTDYYNVRPDEVFFIDDNPENVIAAQKLGIQSVQFKNAETLIVALQNIHILSQ
jgi:HAD superfamily hydrolase (TIGR01509 family)